MRAYLSFLILALMAYSCSNSRLITGTSFQKIDGIRYLVNSKTDMKIQYYGDYRFEKLKKRTTADLSKELRKNIRQSQGKIIYNSYTKMEPFGSTAGFFYKDQNAIEIFHSRKSYVANISDTSINQFEFKVNDIQINALTYVLDQSKTNNAHQINYCEYFFTAPEGTVSILFWSENSMKWIKRESRGVIETLNIQHTEE